MASPGLAHALKLEKVCKTVGGHQVLSDVTLDANYGSITAVLGSSGCGKTTLLGIVAGLQRPDSGRVLVCAAGREAPPESAKHALGLVMQENALFEELTIRENAEYFAEIYGHYGDALAKRINELLASLGLREVANRQVGRLSGGQRKRANILASLMHFPEIVLLDEPTVGLDPGTRRDVWLLMNSFKAEGKCVVFTTHYLQEAEGLSDMVVIMDEGRVVAEGSPAQLRQAICGESIVKLEYSPAQSASVLELEEKIKAGFGGQNVAHSAGVIVVKTDSPAAAEKKVRDVLSKSGVKAKYVQVKKPDLDDVFLMATGKHGAEIAERRANG